MPEFVGYLLMFTAVGVGFILVNLTIGRLLRPARMHAEKATIYECGEPTVGSAWVQFDLRFYVVALLFVIFDVEMAFFFPWAVVFGRANQLADPSLSGEQRAVLASELTPAGVDATARDRAVHALRIADTPEEQKRADENWENWRQFMETQIRAIEEQINSGQFAGTQLQQLQDSLAQRKQELATHMRNRIGSTEPMRTTQDTISRAGSMARLAFVDILFFFGVLLVGFAYLWRRGDLNWVRSYAAQQTS